MSLGRYADYSGGRPSGAALKAAGFVGVIRYVGIGSSGKRITTAEYKDLVANGLKVLLVAEQGTGDAWGTTSDDDHARGLANATAAVADARSMGIPDTVLIAAAADAHAANQGQITDSVAYVRGFRDVLGLGRSGFYGFSETLTAVHSAGVASWYWRCGSQPTQAEQGWTHLWQRNDGTTTVAGVQTDINEQYLPFPNGAPDVELTDAFTTRYGKPLTVQDFFAWADYRITELYSAFMDAGKFPSRIPGDANSTNLKDAILDTVARVSMDLTADNTTAQAVTQLLDAVQKISTPEATVDVEALSASLAGALGDDVAKALGRKLVA